MDSYDIIAETIRSFWKNNYPQDVIAFFQQKYSWDDKWERCEELVECHGCDDYENMTFLSDFCEGQEEVKDVIIVPLREVIAFYYKMELEPSGIKPKTNADRIRAMTDDELADMLQDVATFGGVESNCGKLTTWLDWLKQEVEE